ncbi:MAG: hypothetical protein EOO71_22980 [Myxococcaceae bacterium]|nr:MAG: hypothetical protein EOO71_22980 [Myxococcaceae bacterium]
MRMTLLLGLLSVGLLAACGGVEPEAQDSDVTGQALPPCEQACFVAYNNCMRRAPTQEAQALCLERMDGCYQICEGAAAKPVEALRPPPCEYACELAYNYCRRNAQTPEALALCESERADCDGMCPAPAAKPVEALRPPPCQSRCDLLHELCINEAGTPEAQALCDAERKVCKLACVAPAAQPVDGIE